MGLDITAYRKLTKMDVLFDEDGEPLNPTTREPIEIYVKVYSNPDFPGRSEGLEDRGIYCFEDAADCLSMGYGGYNGWRDQLANLAGYPSTQTQYGKSYAAACWNGATGPFSELINFSDCEGTIGPVVCAKLSKDFADFDERAKQMAEGFYDRYQKLRNGVDMAADGGALKFQ